MATLSTVRRDVRPARRPPTPKRKPARLDSKVSVFRGHAVRKPRSR
ncbi:MAG: hypothetical protein IT405_00810 [Candidatus Yanofskybacteria bacterium]|nr:hypothetical protein [Candidatus Yanofskybacteria bacterium]